MNKIPWHKNEKMFRRYEQHIHQMVINYPQPVSFDTTPLAYTTFSCRFRDSVASLLEYHWKTCIDCLRLAEIWPLVELTPINGMAVVRKKGTKELTSVGSVVDVVSKQDDFLFEIDGSRLKPLVGDGVKQLVKAAVLLLHFQVIGKPVKLKNIPKDMVSEFADQFNVGFSEDSRGFIIML